MTFSIVARVDDGPTGEPGWGVAVASKFLAVGSAVPAAVAGVGAIATQADANVAYKGLALSLLDDGATAQIALDVVLEEDDRSTHRQVGVVDSDGNAATYTGPDCFDWAGGTVSSQGGTGFAIQGNILVGPQVVEQMREAFEASDGQALGHRLLGALAAGDAAGGDRRGRQSAALLVVREGAGYGGHDDLAVDLRVDDHPAPVAELARLLDLNDLYLTASTDAEKIPLTIELAAEVDGLVRAFGHPDLAAWVGSENYEMRVDRADAPTWIDRRVLDILRQSASSSA